MGYVILAMVLAVILVLVLASKFGGVTMFPSDEIETVTTTTTHGGPDYVGTLQRRQKGAQFFVIDPVDRVKIWVNESDDRYEDAEGEVWRLA